jgi:hypothetical protein
MPRVKVAKQSKHFHTNEGHKFTRANSVTAHLNQSGIKYEQTAAYLSTSKGVAKRMNRTLFDPHNRFEGPFTVLGRSSGTALEMLAF